MKKLVLFCLSISLCFAAGFYGAKAFEKETKRGSEINAANPFSPSNYTLVNRPFSIVVVGLNNGATLEKTLSSIFTQNYENFRLIYIDDASEDGSYELARELINRSDRSIPVTFVQNEKRLGRLANVFRAVETCSDEEIVVVVNGEDWLAHEWVLQKLNAYYADPDLWIACGSYMDFPTFQRGPLIDLQNQRNQPIHSQHLKTFYAKLFKTVRESDFIYSGEFLPTCAELAYMTPMLELAENHFHLIDEILYIHNQHAIYKEDRESQLRSLKFIRALEPYAPLTALGVHPCGE